MTRVHALCYGTDIYFGVFSVVLQCLSVITVNLLFRSLVSHKALQALQQSKAAEILIVVMMTKSCSCSILNIGLISGLTVS